MNRSVLLLSITALLGLAGCARLAYQEGLSAVANGRDTDAIRSFEVAERGKDATAATRELALLYMKQHRYEEAASRFRSLDASGGLDGTLQLAYAECLVALGKHDEAIPLLQALRATEPAAARLLQDINALGIRSTEELLQVHPIAAFPQAKWRFMQRFKRFAETSSPVLRDSSLYFTASQRRLWKRTQEPTDVWVAPFTGLPQPDGSYVAYAQRLDDLNTRWHDATPAFHPDGRTVVFSRTDVPVAPTWKERLKLPANWVLNHPIQLFSATGAWPQGYEVAKRLPFCDGVHRFAHPAFAPDGQTLFFTSDRPGGYGGTDLWSVRMTDGVWGEPVNCGASVNTSGNEAYPSLSGDTLWFSSDGHRTIGGLDLLYSVRSTSGWSAPVDVLPEPLNSSRDEFGVQVVKDPASSGQLGVFASDRSGTDGLFLFHRRPWTVDLLVRVVLDADGSPVAGISGAAEFPGSNREAVAFTTDHLGTARLTLARPDSVRIVLPDAVDCAPTAFLYPQDEAIRYHEVEERIAFWQRRGCVDPVACNFDPEASVVDWSMCTYPQPMRDCNGNCLYDWDKDGLCDEECDPRRFEKGENLKTAIGPDPRTVVVPPYGCTYPNACNFDPEATRDNGTCDFVSCYTERPPTARLPRSQGDGRSQSDGSSQSDGRNGNAGDAVNDSGDNGAPEELLTQNNAAPAGAEEDRLAADRTAANRPAADRTAADPMQRMSPQDAQASRDTLRRGMMPSSRTPQAPPRSIDPVFPEEDQPAIDEMNLYWDLDRAEVRPQHRPELALMADYLREHPESQVLISSHCDARASQSYNDRLSRRRSDAVRQELVSRGVRPDQMVSIGRSEDVLGRDCPDGNCDEAVLQSHRKTEVRFISPDMKYLVHRVGPGETLQSVAKLHGIPSRNLMEINGLEEPFVRTEQELLIALPEK
jgi:outer membrane protein OmpA-like peptidoglycan-associated protein